MKGSTKMLKNRLLNLLLLSIVLLWSISTVAQTRPAPAPVREVTETYFDTKVVDPYRWLENTKDPEVVSFMKAQSDYTQSQLASIPGRKELLARIESLDNAGVVVSAV